MVSARSANAHDWVRRGREANSAALKSIRRLSAHHWRRPSPKSPQQTPRISKRPTPVPPTHYCPCKTPSTRSNDPARTDTQSFHPKGLIRPRATHAEVIRDDERQTVGRAELRLGVARRVEARCLA